MAYSVDELPHLPPKRERHLFARILNGFITLVIAGVLVVVVGLLGMQVGDRRLPIEIDEWHVLNPRLHPGDDLEIEVRATFLKWCPTHADRYLFDGAGVVHPLAPVDFDTPNGLIGQDQNVISAIPVPLEAAPGKAIYRVAPIYRCNYVQRNWWPLRGPVIDTHFRILPLTEEALQERTREELQELIIEVLPDMPQQ